MRRKSAAVKVAYPAVLSALALVLVYISAVVPTGNWGCGIWRRRWCP